MEKKVRCMSDDVKGIFVRIRRDIAEYWPAAAALALYTVVVNLIFHAFCPMVIISGFPCPGCGLTRSFLYLASGRIMQSVQINPMGIPIAGILVYFFWNRYIIGKKAKGMSALMVIAVILLLALYVCRMHSFFPNRMPYVYAEKNILSRNFAFYDKILHDLRIL